MCVAIAPAGTLRGGAATATGGAIAATAVQDEMRRQNVCGLAGGVCIGSGHPA